jgi:hypothetical protein
VKHILLFKQVSNFKGIDLPLGLMVEPHHVRSFPQKEKENNKCVSKKQHNNCMHKEKKRNPAVALQLSVCVRI